MVARFFKINRRLALAAAVLALGAWCSDSRAEGTISMDELQAAMVRKEAITIFDARDAKSYRQAHIRGAKLPLPDEYYRLQELFRAHIIDTAPDSASNLADAMLLTSRDSSIVTYCNDNCSAAENLQKQLSELGFTRVRVLEGGIQTWEKKGYPVDSENNPKL